MMHSARTKEMYKRAEGARSMRLPKFGGYGRELDRCRMKEYPRARWLRQSGIEEDGEADVERKGIDNPGYQMREKKEHSRESC